jgi:hypothetical protein
MHPLWFAPIRILTNIFLCSGISDILQRKIFQKFDQAPYAIVCVIHCALAFLCDDFDGIVARFIPNHVSLRAIVRRVGVPVVEKQKKLVICVFSNDLLG